MIFFVLLIYSFVLFASARVIAAGAEQGNASDKKVFDAWKAEHGKMYQDVQTELRAFSIWLENRKIIDTINGHPSLTWKAGLNQFSDLTAEEFGQKYLMTLSASNSTIPTGRKPHEPSDVKSKIPESFDWRSDGGKAVVTSVKNQGSVGSCWAFSTIENIEGQWALAGNTLTDLSPEFLVDCDGTVDGDHADCSVFGGWPYLAYQFIIKSGGVPSEAAWPYCSGTGDCFPCMQGPTKQCGPPPTYCDRTYSAKCNAPYDVAAKISSWTSIGTDESEIASELVSRGPLSVLLDASYLQYYRSGVWDGHIPGTSGYLKCTKTGLNHAVLMVGYGTTAADDTTTTPSTPYWSVKNSWGLKWGEDGYFRIIRGQGQCGINTGVTSCIV